MRTLFTKILTSLILALFLSITVSFAQDVVVNTNGSFEDSDVTASGDTASVEGWTFELQDDAVATFAIVDSVSKDGSRSLAVSVTATGANEYSIQAINEPFSVQEEKNYTLSLWAKSNATGTTANFTVGNPSFDEFGRIGNADVSLTEEWQLFSLGFTVPAGNTEGRAPLHFSFSGNVDNTIFIDSVRITTPVERPDYDPIAEGKAKWLGNVHSSTQLERFLDYWNQITPENSGKWGSVEGTRDEMNWDQLDAAYNLAKNNELPFRFHVLVWGSQQPGWINDLTPEEQLEEIEEWFQAVNDRYPDIDYLEVVNEPLPGHNRPNGVENDADYWDALGGEGETGFDWIITAFQMARDIFPEDTKLMINDYGIVGNSSAVSQYLQIINELKERGLIDRIGVQAHAFSNGSAQASGTTPGSIKRSLDQLATAGLPIQATELDIDGLGSDPGSDESDDYQLRKIQDIFPVFWEHPMVEGVTFWGWRLGMWRSSEDAMLWGINGRPRPSLEWLEAYVDTASVIPVSNEPINQELPSGFSLEQNYPNPFNPTTNISFTIPNADYVQLKVFDMVGREVATLIDSRISAGQKTVQFNASNLSSGTYLYRIQTSEFISTRKLVLIK
ncbi:MAG: hypothetical protein CL670_12355 [Balneola sp.]|jgi:endo-1,4-beta-xylanase|nr:hypothetical protein [Balneola sp.]MBE79940.1 hypothetical protein [Balneola sp.]|tara:strand:+ start:3086 stop:4933 length:1848 start_codon:yes stop_codon:yes gene_type:complete